MTTEELILLTPGTSKEASGTHASFVVAADQLQEVAASLRNRSVEPFEILVSLIGIDNGDSLGVVYQLATASFGEIVIIKCFTDNFESPSFQSVHHLWDAAFLNERELFGLLGIRFIDHPDMRRLFMRTDWNGFPLRKSYDASPQTNPIPLEHEPDNDILTRLTLNQQGEIETTESMLFERKEYVVNIGPQHPATHGVLHFRVSIDGEIIKKVDPHLGYIHRGVEKMCESMTYPQWLHLTERLDYLSAHTNRSASCMCIENALGLEIPDRVAVIRTIMDELSRIASHLLGWSCMCMDMGALTAFIYGMRDREKILDIFEQTCGGRLIPNYSVIGGLMHDLHPDFQKQVKAFISYLRAILPEYHEIFTHNIIARERMIGIGILSRADAISHAVTGPVGRASGFSCDVRKYRPYGAYNRVQFREILRTEGDTYARYMNRLDEIVESLSIIEQLIDAIPDGPVLIKTKPVIRLPEGEYRQWVETARGLFEVYIASRGEKTPWRVKFRSPGLSLISVVSTLAEGEKIADLISIGGSLDYVVPDIDR
ncbi:MAG: NADH-quinone oxidoreductase subunit D [Bacteroidales bacterium]